ncbi:MAG: hypothetical protein ABWZ76_01150 [Acidimicrobiales bacterium]
MSSATVLLLVLLGSVVVSAVIAFLIVRSSRARADAALEPLGATLRRTAASALGRTDDVPMQGTGTLVLTTRSVAFAQWRPARLLEIPRADIVRTDTTREHLGKTLKEDVLRITWRAGGTEEAIAFFLRDLEPWLADLGGRRSATEA